MTEGLHTTGHHAALAMLDVFASVGATRFDVTWTTCIGDKVWFRRAMSIAELRRTLPTMIESATSKQHNVIVRPSGPAATFIQLDDLKVDQLTPLAPAVFLALETSPRNFQAWVALSPLADKDFGRRLRKGTGADTTASGATRVAGSLNFKDKYAPDFPRVAIHVAHVGRVTTVDVLEQLGLVAPPEPVTEQLSIAPPRARPGPGSRRWPSYARCLDGAPLNSEETGPDTSRADFVWCMTALTWGWGKDEIVARLMEESSKARTNGRGYADLTVRNAVLAVERRREQPRGHRIG
jgi:RepB DNA-primase from phage plasmid